MGGRALRRSAPVALPRPGGRAVPRELRQALRLPANAVVEAVIFNALDKGAARRDTAFPEWAALLDQAFPDTAADAIIPATVTWVARDKYVSRGHSLVLARLLANPEHIAWAIGEGRRGEVVYVLTATLENPEVRCSFRSAPEGLPDSLMRTMSLDAGAFLGGQDLEAIYTCDQVLITTVWVKFLRPRSDVLQRGQQATLVPGERVRARPESYAHEGLSLIHISEPTRPY